MTLVNESRALKRSRRPARPNPATSVLQRALGELGVGELVVDGWFGPKTQSTVRTFQRGSGLTADGIVGRRTAAAINVHLRTIEAERERALRPRKLKFGFPKRWLPILPAAKLEAQIGLELWKSYVDALDERGIVGFGPGNKVVDGEDTGELAAVFFVSRKRPRSRVKTPIPEWVSVGRKRIPTDVQEEQPHVPLYGQALNRQRYRPIPGGTSIEDVVRNGPATFGVRATDFTVTPAESVMLTNGHVLTALAAVPVIQPATLDGGNVPADQVGTARRRFIGQAVFIVPFWGLRVSFFVDGGVVGVDARLVDDIVHLGPPARILPAVARNLFVAKSGRTTGVTFGMVTNPTYSGLYTIGGQLRRITGVFRSRLQSRGGDSGALVVTHLGPLSTMVPLLTLFNNWPIGLLFGGNVAGTHALASYIVPTIIQMRVRF